MPRSCRPGSCAWLSFLGLSVAALLFLGVATRRRAPVRGPSPASDQYFKDIDFHSHPHRLGAVSHCDARFAPIQAPNDEELRATLRGLLSSYASTMQSLDVQTWLAHGTLLGWYWNRELLPWDTDVDVQMAEADIVMLGSKHNFTTFEHPLPRGPLTRTYLLDINPHHSIVSLSDVANKIDGRWIDQANGKYVDITAVHDGNIDVATGDVPALFCKDGHRYWVMWTLSVLESHSLADLWSRSTTSSLSNDRWWTGRQSTFPGTATRSCAMSMAPGR